VYIQRPHITAPTPHLTGGSYAAQWVIGGDAARGDARSRWTDAV